MSLNAAYASTPRYSIISVTGPNTAYDGTGTIETLFTAGDGGSRVDSITYSATGNNANGALKFYGRESSEDTWKLIFTVVVPATTIDYASLTGPWWGFISQLQWVLSAGAQIGVAVHASETWNVHASFAGDF